VASKPILLPAPCSGAACRGMSTGPCHDLAVALRMAVGKYVNSTSCSPWTVDVLVYHDD